MMRHERRSDMRAPLAEKILRQLILKDSVDKA
jgi:hypothetical protein